MSRAEQIALIAQRYVDQKKFAGIEWTVERRGRVLSQGQVGLADVEAKKPIPPDAIYRVYSMTKPIVSVMALILIEQGKLRLYDPIAAYDSKFANMRVLLPSGALIAAERPITVEDLITHRAGFTYEFITGCHVAKYYQDEEIVTKGSETLGEMMERLSKLPLAFHPGTQFRYSVCVDVLAHICERASGRRIDELLKRYIFEPLGMNDTAYYVPESKRARLMKNYGVADIAALSPLDPHPHDLKPIDVEDMYPSNSSEKFQRGGHGLFATLADYTKFARMLLDGKAADGSPVLSRKTIEMMRANRIPASQLPLRIGIGVLAGYGWGLGVRVMTDLGQAQSLTGLGELGWAGAATTYFWVDPAEAMVGVVMTQYLGSMIPLSDDMRTAAYQMLD